MPYPRYSLDEQGNPVDWGELIEAKANELAQALGRIAELEDALRWIAGHLALGRTAGRSAVDLLGIEEHARSVVKYPSGADLPQAHPTDPDLEQLAGDLLAKFWPLVDPSGREAIRREVQDFMLSRLTLPAFFHIVQVEAAYPHLYQFLQSTAQEEAGDDDQA